MSPIGGCSTPFICPIIIPPNELDAAEAPCDDRVRLKQLQNRIGMFGNDNSYKWCQVSPIGSRSVNFPPDLADLMPSNATSMQQPSATGGGGMLHRTLESFVQDLRGDSHFDPLTPSTLPTPARGRNSRRVSGAGRLPRRLVPALTTPSTSLLLNRNSSNRTTDPIIMNNPSFTRPNAADLSAAEDPNYALFPNFNPTAYVFRGEVDDNGDDDDFLVDQEDEIEIADNPDE